MTGPPTEALREPGRATPEPRFLSDLLARRGAWIDAMIVLAVAVLGFIVLGFVAAYFESFFRIILIELEAWLAGLGLDA